ncbi:MAG TPA: M1 family metallopeptidase, partial [Myxococcales bacterium]|nr:M1 family metallopeptidase [Myxococcales bacterium]
LEAVLDPVHHTVAGKERLAWRNRSALAVRSLYFHLYLNAFEGSGSTFMTEKTRYGGFRTGVDIEKGEWGYIELRKVQQDGADLAWNFVHPDGGPESDHTVVRIDLSRPVPSGGTAVVDLEFFDQLPRVVARSGWFGTFHFVAQWFPKVGVLELPGERGATAPRWNCHEYHLFSEFYADFGAYEATIVAPADYVVGAVGEEQGAPQPVAGGLSHHFVQPDVHDFAFAADANFREMRSTYEGEGSPRVVVRVLYPQEYERAARATLDATVEALGYFSRTLGPYPYRTSTAVVPPFNALEAGGMEYETFFTSVGFNEDPLLEFTRFVAIHEFGHGYFMGMLASNEFEEPFLDEGLNEFWDARLVASKRVPIRFPALRRFGVPEWPLDWWDYLRVGGTSRFAADPIAGNSWDRYSSSSYGQVYSRTALVFHDLGELLGDDVLARAMRAYFDRWKFRHPSAADLRASFEESTGRADLVDAWFDAQVYAAQPIDDRIELLESNEVLPEPGTFVSNGQRVERDQREVDAEVRKLREQFRKQHRKDGGSGPFPFRTIVQARRYGAQVPQTVLVGFEDGSVERMWWPPGEGWHRWVLQKPVRATFAQLDPERRYYLDLDKLDDGRARDHRLLPANRWSLEVGAWLSTLIALLEAL